MKGDAPVLADTIVKFSQMMAELQGLLQGVNLSLMVLPEGQGVKVIDASIRLSRPRHRGDMGKNLPEGTGWIAKD